MKFLQVAVTAALLCAVGQAAKIPPLEDARFSTLRSRSYEDRRDVLGRAPEAARHKFWVDKLETYRDENANSLKDNQIDALEQAIDLAKTRDKSKLDNVDKVMNAAFGKDEAKEILTSLGGESQPSSLKPRIPDCECSVLNDWCADWCEASGGALGECTWSQYWCGTVQLNECDGMCFDDGHSPGDGRP